MARAIVLRRLTAAPRSRAQLAADLAARAVPAQVAGRVLDRFTEVGLVDDPAFAEAWVRSRRATRALSRRALRQELRAKGVDDETTAAALDGLDDEAEARAARVVARQRLGATRGLPGPVRLRRLVGVLARKGYPSGLALRVAQEELLAQAEQQPEQQPEQPEQPEQPRPAEAPAPAEPAP